jgi:hypothetical protein
MGGVLHYTMCAAAHRNMILLPVTIDIGNDDNFSELITTFLATIGEVGRTTHIIFIYVCTLH